MKTKSFNTAFKSARQMYVSSASSIKSIPPHPNYWWSNILLSYHLRLRLDSGAFDPSIPHENPLYDIPLPHTHYTPKTIQFFHFINSKFWVSNADG